VGPEYSRCNGPVDGGRPPRARDPVSDELAGTPLIARLAVSEGLGGGGTPGAWVPGRLGGGGVEGGLNPPGRSHWPGAVLAGRP